MTELAIQVLSGALLAAGAFFMLVGATGFIRMPDVYTRMHAASLIDTLGAGFICIGLMLLAGFSLISAKLVFILALLFFTGPVVTHALAQAALHVGVKPRLAEDRRDRPLGKSAKLKAAPGAGDQAKGE